MKENSINQQYKELNEKIMSNVLRNTMDDYKNGSFPIEPALDISNGHYGKWKAFKLVVYHDQCQVAIYFDHRIRMSIIMHKKIKFRDQVWYSLIDPNSEDEMGCLVKKDPPEKKEEYIRILYEFLFAFLCLAVRIKANTSEYMECVPKCYLKPDFPFQ